MKLYKINEGRVPDSVRRFSKEVSKIDADIRSVTSADDSKEIKELSAELNLNGNDLIDLMKSDIVPEDPKMARLQELLKARRQRNPKAVIPFGSAGSLARAKLLVQDDLPVEKDFYDALVKQNLKMVLSIAYKFANKGVPIEDLIGAGNLGLVTALHKYKNPVESVEDEDLEGMSDEEKDDYMSSIKKIITGRKKAKFSSVAHFWIKAFILGELNNNSRTIRIPKHLLAKNAKAIGAYQRDGMIDIDAPTRSGQSLHNKISDPDAEQYSYDAAETLELQFRTLNGFLNKLGTEEKKVLKLAYGIGYDAPMKGKDIANVLNISPATVSRLINSAIVKLSAEFKAPDELIAYMAMLFN